MAEPRREGTKTMNAHSQSPSTRADHRAGGTGGGAGPARRNGQMRPPLGLGSSMPPVSSMSKAAEEYEKKVRRKLEMDARMKSSVTQSSESSLTPKVLSSPPVIVSSAVHAAAEGYDEEMRRKLEMSMPPVSDASRAMEEYEKKVRQKLEMENRSSSMLASSESVRPKNPLSRMTATGAESAFDERLRRKLSEDHGATERTTGHRPARRRSTSMPQASSTIDAVSAFDERLRRKLSQEDGGTEKTTGRSRPARRRGSSLPRVSSAVHAAAEGYDEEMRRKLEMDNRSVSIPPSPESDRPAKNLSSSAAASSGADHAPEEGQRRKLAGNAGKETAVVGRRPARRNLQPLRTSMPPMPSANTSANNHEESSTRRSSDPNLTLDQKIEMKKLSNKIKKSKGKGRSSNAHSSPSKERQRSSKEEVAAELRQKRMSRHMARRGLTHITSAGDDADGATFSAASSVSGHSGSSSLEEGRMPGKDALAEEMPIKHTSTQNLKLGLADDGDRVSKREAVAAELRRKRMQQLRRFVRGTTFDPIDEGNEEDLSRRSSRELGGIKARISSCGDICLLASWECGNCAYVNESAGSLCKICQEPNPDFSDQEGRTKEAPSNGNEIFPTITAKDDLHISWSELGGAIAKASKVSASEKKPVTLADIKKELHTSWSDLGPAIALATERSAEQDDEWE